MLSIIKWGLDYTKFILNILSILMMYYICTQNKLYSKVRLMGHHTLQYAAVDNIHHNMPVPKIKDIQLKKRVISYYAYFQTFQYFES